MGLFEFLNKLADIIRKIKKGVPLSKEEIELVADVIQKDATRVQLFANALLNSALSLPPESTGEAKAAIYKLRLLTASAIKRRVVGGEPFNEEDMDELAKAFDVLGFEGKPMAASFKANFTLVFGYGFKEALDDINNKLEEKAKEVNKESGLFEQEKKKSEKEKEKLM